MLSQSSRNMEDQVKGYMYVSEPNYLEKLNVTRYLNGEQNEAMQSRIKITNLPVASLYKYYDSLHTLFREQLKNGPSGLVEGGSYILRLGYDQDKTYQLIQDGAFHLAIIDAQEFLDVYACTRNGEKRPIRTVVNEHFNPNLTFPDPKPSAQSSRSAR